MDMMENLIVSWLKHIKQCSLVESNYKMSRIVGVTDKTEKLYSEIKADLPYNRTLQTLLVEAEIDAVGLYSDSDSKVLYAIDTAYHDDGIVYGDDTVKSILN